MIEDSKEKIMLKLRRGSQEVFEHEPRELFLSIDGDPQASRKIETELTEIRVELAEMPEFIEIFSEQNVRLAFLSLTEDSAGFKKLREFPFHFSNDRKICLEIEKTSTQTRLRATYENPHFADAALLAETISEDLSFDEFLRDLKTEPVEAQIFGTLLDSRRKNENSFGARLKAAFSFINPKAAFAGATLAAVLVAALLFSNLFVPGTKVSAAELIEKTVAAEQSSESDTEKIIYRVLDFEEKSADGATLKKRRIEIFKDAARKLSVRRLFDENNQLIAGEWRRADGVSTIYRLGKTSELRLEKTDRDIIGENLENVWQLSLSAKSFQTLIELPENATAETENGGYRINYGSPAAAENGITKAVLFINNNLRADKLFLTVRQNNATREFFFTEAAFEQKPSASVEKAAFEPNPEFLKTATLAGKTNPEIVNSEKLPESVEESKAALPAENPAAAAATPELEVKVLQLLNQVNALSGEQIKITKTPAGKIEIRGIVDAKRRRDEILGALSEVRGNPAVSVNIQTAEEAAKTKPAQKSDGTLESITLESRNSIPAGDALREYFAAQGVSEDRLEAEVRRFASASLAKSSQVRRSALQLKQIAERFSPAELEKMDETAKTNWRRLIRQNAAVLAQNAESLRGDLRGALNIAAGNSSGNVDSSSDADLIRAAKRLFELSLAIDRDVRAPFSAGGGRGAAAVKSAGFAGNLAEIIGLARQLR
jgi:hypothetical protein